MVSVGQSHPSRVEASIKSSIVGSTVKQNETKKAVTAATQTLLGVVLSCTTPIRKMGRFLSLLLR